MPLPAENIRDIVEYVRSHLPDDAQYETMFDFVTDTELKTGIIQEFKAARYIYKLMEALNVDGLQLHAHVKFQITQYASIYEAIIVYLLWVKFASSPHVLEIERHRAYKKVSEWPKNLTVSLDDEQIHLCAYRMTPTPRVSIKFNDKVDAAVKIGFILADLGEEIKSFYRLRNSIHIESAVRNRVQFEIDQARLAYRRVKPFVEGIKSFLISKSVTDIGPLDENPATGSSEL